MKDEFEIEVLPDGTLKITTGSFSPDIHVKAEKFNLDMLDELAEEKEKHKHTHSHVHEHTHTKVRG